MKTVLDKLMGNKVSLTPPMGLRGPLVREYNKPTVSVRPFRSTLVLDLKKISWVLIILAGLSLMACPGPEDPKPTVPNYFTITFDATGGMATPSRQVISGDALGTVPTPTRSGYTFAGWFTAANGGGTEYTATTTITESKTLYAKWVPATNPKQVIVTGLSVFNSKRFQVLISTALNYSNDTIVAGYYDPAGPTISDGSTGAVVTLFTEVEPQQSPWTGSGSYYVVILIRTPDETYHKESAFISIQKIPFTSVSTTIVFSPPDYIQEGADPVKLQGTWNDTGPGNATVKFTGASYIINEGGPNESTGTFVVNGTNHKLKITAPDSEFAYSFTNDTTLVLTDGHAQLNGTYTKQP
ncbi:repeat protein [Treponema primitia ZAS-2]|uniref:Repeat protein n=1 Tax=Treponema primitia (strain ATCC BAA-887 / DSM 12427 / ZAS-2) TaxID=545694 RepID=F5YKT2_TREPZ|nr:InlB B-repeat-containing protein [Treponema primitia]AEF84170.1 repeat protein [Treponema primitia ZAS-2]